MATILGPSRHSDMFTHAKNIGRLWLAYTELQGDFTCYNSYLLTLATLHSQLRMWACSDTTSYWKGSWAVID